MLYKTMVLEFLQEQLPTLHEQLRASRTLLSTVNAYAADLKSSHAAWMADFRSTRPDGDSSQMASEALERALEEMQERLRDEFSPDETGPLTLEAAMAFIRRHTPPA